MLGGVKMKATGIVRRIDDLGRIVIPKEIRRAMRIKEGDPLEIFTTSDGEIVLKSIEPNKMQENEILDYFETLGDVEQKQLVVKLIEQLG